MFLLIDLLYLVLILGLYKRAKKINIALINCGMWWFLSTAIVVLDLPMNITIFAFVFANVLLFSVGYLIITPVNRGRNVEQNDNSVSETERHFLTINKVIILINIIALIYLANSLGFKFSTFLNIKSLMVKMNSISHARYSDDADYLPVINRIVNSLVYATCGYCGFFSARKIRPVLFVNILLIMVQTVLVNTKATFVFGVAFFLAGLLTGMAYFGKIIRVRYVVYLLMGMLILLIFATTINYWRHAGQFTYGEEFEKIIVGYFVGPYSALSLWQDNGGANYNIDLGANTFSSIFRILGISSQTHGEFVYVDGISTNVYTLYKHLITDYTYAGTIMISLILGFLSLASDQKVANRRRYSVGFSIVVTTIILISFFSSLFRYTTNVLAAVIIIFVALPISYGNRRI